MFIYTDTTDVYSEVTSQSTSVLFNTVTSVHTTPTISIEGIVQCIQ